VKTIVTAARSSRKTPAAKPFDVAAWMATESGYDHLTTLARKVAGLAMSTADDMVSEIAVVLLENATSAPKTEAKFIVWAGEQAEAVAKRLRDERLRYAATPTDTDILAATVEEGDDDNETEFEFCSELIAHERKLKSRVRTALSKLTEQHREAIHARYFAGVSLTDVAAERGGCNSSERMRLLRAKKKLATLIDSNGYALAA
jgi:RNA polymerase sigma factor (sigma-70 family)